VSLIIFILFTFLNFERNVFWLVVIFVLSLANDLVKLLITQGLSLTFKHLLEVFLGYEPLSICVEVMKGKL